MKVRKIAISLPSEVLLQVDRLAKKTGSTRSGLISQILREVSQAKSKSEITERINVLFADADLKGQQSEISALFLQAADSAFEDPEW